MGAAHNCLRNSLGIGKGENAYFVYRIQFGKEFSFLSIFLKKRDFPAGRIELPTSVPSSTPTSENSAKKCPLKLEHAPLARLGYINFQLRI
jgi:hypothetical protein